MSGTNCYGCTCVKNYNDDTEYCGRIVRDGRRMTTIGCNKVCPQCKSCKYEIPKKKESNNNTNSTENKKPNNSKKNNTNKTNNNDKKENNSSSLSEQELLDFLKEQEDINSYEEGIYTIENSNDNSNSAFPEAYEGPQNNLSVPSSFDMAINNNDNNNNLSVNNGGKTCLDQNIETCTVEKGCVWNNPSLICENLKVTFYGAEKTSGTSFTLTIGNYDISDIDNFEFYPSYVSVPFGLRVKIWHKEGYVGFFDSYLGNHKQNNIDDKQLYPIKNLGSIQICNMVNCEKPSKYSDMRLVNIMDGNNVDRIDKVTIKNMGEYKNKLRRNIINRVKYIKATQGECIQEVINFLRHNGVNIHKNFMEENDIGILQRIKFILNNIPNCQQLLIYKNYRNPNEEKE